MPADGSATKATGHLQNDDRYLNEDQIEELKAAFRVFDRDGDGSITAQELGEVMRSIGSELTEEEVTLMVEKFDTNKNGTIEFDEFLPLMYHRMKETDSQVDMRRAFDILDQDKDGLIGSRELRHVMMNLGEMLSEDDIADMVSAVDQDGDGKIDFKEFLRVVNSR